MEGIPRDIVVCQDSRGRESFSDWLAGLEAHTEAVILKRISRVGDGNFGDVKPVGGGVFELRIDFGPGYRVYFGEIGTEVHIIRGGMKKSQSSDIKASQEFWRVYAAGE